MKLSKLIELSNKFYKIAFSPFLSLAREVPELESDILEKAENFDIKDEDLYNLFSKFIEVYKEFLNNIEFDISDLESDNYGEAAELAGKLQKLYKQIQELPYLSMSEEEGYEEEFSSDDLIELLNQAMDNASSAIRNASGMEISDAAAAQIANEFNNQQIDRGSFSNSGLRMTGAIVQQKLAAQRKYLQSLKFNYESAQAFKAKKRERAKKFKEENPEIYKALILKLQRNKKERNEKRQRLLRLIESTTDPKIKSELEKELLKLELDSKKHLTKKDYEGREIETTLTIDQAKQQADVLARQRILNQKSNANKKLRKESGGIVGAIETLTTQISNTKTAAKLKITKSIVENPKLVQIKTKLNEIGEKVKTNPTLELVKLKDSLEKEYTDITLELLSNDPLFMEVKNDMNLITEFRDKVSKAQKANWLNENSTPEQKDFSFLLISDAQKLIDIYNKKYKALSKTLETLKSEIKLNTINIGNLQ